MKRRKMSMEQLDLKYCNEKKMRGMGRCEARKGRCKAREGKCKAREGRRKRANEGKPVTNHDS